MKLFEENSRCGRMNICKNNSCGCGCNTNDTEAINYCNKNMCCSCDCCDDCDDDNNYDIPDTCNCDCCSDNCCGNGNCDCPCDGEDVNYKCEDETTDCGCGGKMSCRVNVDFYNLLNSCQITDLLKTVKIAHLAVAENEQPYIVPMCFKMKCACGKPMFYLYSKDFGKKMHCLENNAMVSLEFDMPTQNGYSSVVVIGTAEIMETPKTAMCSQDMLTIKVTTDSIEGREYTNCGVM